MEKKQYKTSCKGGGVCFDIITSFLLFFFRVFPWLPWQKNLFVNKMKGGDALYKEKMRQHLNPIDPKDPFFGSGYTEA